MMKLLAVFAIGLLSISLACNNHKKTADGGETKADSLTTPGQLQKEEMLQGLTAYTEQQMENKLPAAIAGATVSNKSSGKENGAAYARALYTLNDSVAMDLTVFDCGGGEGAGFYKYQFIDRLSAGDATTTITDFNGNKAIEQYNDDSYRSTFTYISDRYMVILESESMDIAGLKKMAKGLKLE